MLKTKLAEQEQKLLVAHQKALEDTRDKEIEKNVLQRKTFEDQLSQTQSQNKLLEQVSAKIKQQLEEEITRKDELCNQQQQKCLDLQTELEQIQNKHRDQIAEMDQAKSQEKTGLESQIDELKQKLANSQSEALEKEITSRAASAREKESLHSKMKENEELERIIDNYKLEVQGLKEELDDKTTALLSS